MPFVGNAAGLRAWAARTGLPALPDPGSAAALSCVACPGRCSTVQNPEGKFVLVSSDDGLCSVVTDKAASQPVTEALEAGLRQAGLRYRLAIERDDSHVSAIHDREYLATKDGRGWRVLAATVKDDKDGEAMLTAAPE